jgi:fumarate reductase iron-sulfur subunit
MQNQTGGPAGPGQDGAFMAVRIWRGDAAGRYQTYRVPRLRNQTVLDVVTWVQRHLEPTLAYRFACRVGMCGSCAMTVNGRPRWTCRTHIAAVAAAGPLRIGPLRNLPVLRDLAVDMTPFFEKWQRAEARFEGGLTRHDPPKPVLPDSPARREADLAIECINCGVCHAACEVVGWDPAYVGPAALNRAWSLARDERHTGQAALRAAVGGDGGTFACHSHGACSEHCPVGLDPSRSIAGLKRWATSRRSDD